MTIRVTDFSTSLVRQRDFDHVIGLLDPGFRREWEPKLKGDLKRSMFWVDDIWFGPHAPTEELVREIVEVIHQKGLLEHSKKVLVHCFAGISRSTATAIGLLIMRHPDWTMEQIYNQMEIIRPIMYPNESIIGHFDTVLGLGGKLVEQHLKWTRAVAQRDGLLWIPPTNENSD